MKKLLVLLALCTAVLSACGSPNTKDGTAPAPEFTLPNSLGGNVSLSDYEGKNVLLFFHMAVG